MGIEMLEEREIVLENKAECRKEASRSRLLSRSSEKVSSESVLIVEDEIDTVLELSDWLEGKKIDFVATSEPQDALVLALQNESIRVVVVDAYMSRMSGYTLISAIKSLLPSERLVKFVLITGHPTSSDYARAKKLGVTEFLEKPLDLDLFERMLRNGTTSQMPDA
jgi:DNA-binding NtrC family response regulator